MSITIAPLEITPSGDNKIYPGLAEKDPVIKDRNQPIQYWGIYLDNEAISYTSSKDHAEKTKKWMEKWLRNQL